jgi:hypothetical protein
MDLRYILLPLLIPGSTLSAEVTLPRILTSHMVIQRNMPVHIGDGPRRASRFPSVFVAEHNRPALGLWVAGASISRRPLPVGRFN